MAGCVTAASDLRGNLRYDVWLSSLSERATPSVFFFKKKLIVKIYEFFFACICFVKINSNFFFLSKEMRSFLYKFFYALIFDLCVN